MTDPRIEQVCRKLCETNGVNPDDPMLVPDGKSADLMWHAYIRLAKEHIAAFDYLYTWMVTP